MNGVNRLIRIRASVSWILPVVLGLITIQSAARVITIGPVDLAGRPVSDIRVEGLREVDLKLVTNQIRLKKGDAYDSAVIEQDIVRVTHLGRFGSVQARVEQLEDGSVVVIYQVIEQPLLRDVQVVGNKAFTDQELLKQIVLRAGDPIDPFLIDKAVKSIETAYSHGGYAQVQVTIDEQILADSNILLLRIREGPLVRIKKMRFRGNKAFPDKLLKSKIQSKSEIFILRKGQLNREQLDLDAARIRDHYRSEGYLDVRVGPIVETAPNLTEAVVWFVIEEGPRYLVASIRVQGHHLFSTQQILERMTLKVGDVYTSRGEKDTVDALIDMYGKLGFIETRVLKSDRRSIGIDRLFHEDRPLVDLLVTVEEGIPYTVGMVKVRGNQVTKDKVIYREIRGLEPGRRFDRSGIDLTQNRLEESALFSDAQITILGTPQDEQRDVLIEVKEQRTGSLVFGAGISSDAGVLGTIGLTERNFDIGDWPGNWDEFRAGFTGGENRAFRGAGQYFSLHVRPGAQLSSYAIALREPHILDTSYFLDSNFRYFSRKREDFDEQRLGGSLGLGKRFGDVWSVRVRARADEVEISDIDGDAPIDVFEVEGGNFITSLGLSATRNTTDSRVFPTRGNRLTMGVKRAGLLGGEFDFTQTTAELRQFWTVEEDFFGRKTVLSWRGEAGIIFEGEEAPLFEEFYAGGHRNFRGFKFRGIGPRGIIQATGQPGKDPVGGRWLFLLGLEYNFPVYQEVLRGVFFIDTGTVQDDLAFDEYRVAIGGGVRLRVPFFGAAPIALDVAVPVLNEDGDEKRIFSFDIALPF